MVTGVLFLLLSWCGEPNPPPIVFPSMPHEATRGA